MQTDSHKVERDAQSPFSATAISRNWRFLALISTSSAIAFLLVSYLITPVYQGQVLVIPVKSTSQAANLFQLPGAITELASLAGMSASSSDVAEALEVLKSRTLTEKLVVELKLEEMIGRSSLLSRILGRSASDSYPEKFRHAVRRFHNSLLTVAEDKRTGVIYVNVFWRDRQLAAEWANALVRLANEELRSRAIEESKKRLDYLSSEAEKTSIVALRDAMYRVVEAEVKTMMLARARSEFAFRVIDPAIAADRGDYVKPNRLALMTVGFLLGGIAALLFRQRRQIAA